tara:strand:+ start:16 stop:408 length:393 start_codon:yes stop_codon:yes gene_type:complete
MPSNLYKKKTPPMVGAPVPKKKTNKNPVKKKDGLGKNGTMRRIGPIDALSTKMMQKKKTKVKTKNPKNKNIVDTPMKNIPKSLVKKTKQKIKNVLNNTPKQNVKKAVKMAMNYNPALRALKNVYNRSKKK